MPLGSLCTSPFPLTTTPAPHWQFIEETQIICPIEFPSLDFSDCIQWWWWLTSPIVPGISCKLVIA